MKKLIMLPTTEATRLFLKTQLDKLTYYHKPQQGGEIYRFEVKNQHLYIVSLEEITEKDLPCYVIYNNTVQNIDMVNVLKEVNKECSGKIISCTNDSLKLPYIKPFPEHIIESYVNFYNHRPKHIRNKCELFVDDNMENFLMPVTIKEYWSTNDLRKLTKDLFEHLSAKEPNGLSELELNWLDSWVVKESLSK